MQSNDSIFQKVLNRPLLLIVLGSILLHLIIALGIGSWKIYNIFTEDEAEIQVFHQPAAIQPKYREYKLKTMQSQRSTAITPQVPIALDQNSDINIPLIKIAKNTKNNSDITARGSTNNTSDGFGNGMGNSSGFSTLFGNTSPLIGSLEGTLIDFKQDRFKESPPNKGWMESGKDFLRNFDLREFRKFFNSPQKLYATHFYIPMMSADVAPRSYGVENLVAPSHWVAIYQGKFRSEHGGVFRFVGTADDILIVGVDGKIVLSAGFPQYNPSKWRPKKDPQHEPPAVSEYLPKLTEGDWFKLPPNSPMDITVVVGEIPGGDFASYLFIEERGADYKTTRQGRPILPVFKLKDFSRAEQKTIQADYYEKQLDGSNFGFY